MIIEIDDAGTGSLVGGLVIAIRKGDNYVHRIIPVKVFQDRTLYSKLKDMIAETVLRMLEEISLSEKFDEILLCQGDIFSKTAMKLEEVGIKYSLGSINSTLQDYVETAFDLHLTILGVPRNLIKKLKDYRDYTLELIKWVIINLDERKKHVKTLYPIWEKKWSKSEIIREEIRSDRNRYCINCGENIRKGEAIYKITILTPQGRYRAFTHIECNI